MAKHTTSAKPPVWKMVKEAVEVLGGTTTNIAVRDWILKKYPGTNSTTIGCNIIAVTAREYKLHLTLADVPHVDAQTK